MNFIIAQVYSNYIDANIIMGRLEEEGINCWLKDENTVTIDPILTNAVGGIKLMKPLWENALGKNWEKIMTRDRLRKLYEKL